MIADATEGTWSSVGIIAGGAEPVSASVGMVIGAVEAVLGAAAFAWLGDIKQNSSEAKPLSCEHLVGVRRFELLTSSVSGKRSPPELNARSRVRKCARDNITEPELGGKNIFKNRLHCGIRALSYPFQKSLLPRFGCRIMQGHCGIVLWKDACGSVLPISGQASS